MTDTAVCDHDWQRVQRADFVRCSKCGYEANVTPEPQSEEQERCATVDEYANWCVLPPNHAGIHRFHTPQLEQLRDAAFEGLDPNYAPAHRALNELYDRAAAVAAERDEWRGRYDELRVEAKQARSDLGAELDVAERQRDEALAALREITGLWRPLGLSRATLLDAVGIARRALNPPASTAAEEPPE